MQNNKYKLIKQKPSDSLNENGNNSLCILFDIEHNDEGETNLINLKGQLNEKIDRG